VRDGPTSVPCSFLSFSSVTHFTLLAITGSTGHLHLEYGQSSLARPV